MDQQELNSKLLEAAEKGDFDRIWELVEQGADINSARNKYGWTALMLAAQWGHLTPELLEALVSRGADVNARDKDGETAMMRSALHGHLTPELKKTLSDPHKREEHPSGGLLMLEALVSRGADVNARDNKGRTALMYAARYGHLTPELLEALVSRGADVNARTKGGRTVLWFAALWGHLTPELLETLVSRGADVNARDKDGMTALMLSAYNGYLTPEFLESLISRGADINARDENGMTALMLSARSGSLTPELLEALVSRGADASACDSDGWTALMYVAQYGHLTQELARAFAEQFIRLGTSLEEIQKQLPASKEAPAILVPVLIDKLESEPGLVVDFMKKHVGKKLQEWVDNNVEGANILVSRLVPYIVEKRSAHQNVGFF